MNSDCIFCQIIAGQLPSTTVYEDPHTLAFLDIAPIVKGHTLVIPKTHHDPLLDTPGPILEQLILVVRKIARAMRTGLDAAGINITQANGPLAGQIVPHVHFHIIPRFNDDQHSWATPQGEYDNDDDRRRFATRIQSAITSDPEHNDG